MLIVIIHCIIWSIRIIVSYTFTRSPKNPSGHHWKHGVTKHHHCGGRQQTPPRCGDHGRAGAHCCLVQRGSSKNVTACTSKCVLPSVNTGSQQYSPSPQTPPSFRLTRILTRVQTDCNLPLSTFTTYYRCCNFLFSAYYQQRRSCESGDKEGPELLHH